ncbi:sensor histidine kinase [Taibaiella chishuiensis]|uniref:Histidine kinase n=1 Tax=Taibaiella chishuiensis TaxID=1434707 RepID=A0A2P8D6E6_9BACT|nr:histidine kinase [Taibaiella chishuiensis]PSK92749.1 histidine kinase [Taibaiella chishuiensis]
MSLSYFHFQNKRWVTVLQHVILWLFIFALPYLMQYNYGFRFRFYGPPHHFIIRDIAAKLIWVVVFYLNAFVFTPRYIYRKKYVRYGLLVIGMLLVIVCCNNMIMNRSFATGFQRTSLNTAPARPYREVHTVKTGEGPVMVTARIPEDSPVLGEAIRDYSITPALPLAGPGESPDPGAVQVMGLASQDYSMEPALPMAALQVSQVADDSTMSRLKVANVATAPALTEAAPVQFARAIPAMPATLLDAPSGLVISFLGAAVFNLAPYFLTLAASLAFRMMRDKTRAEALVQERQQENLKTELSFLRSQISPHFMFNVLNNINALARLKSDELEPTIIKLSSLMRYMLYDTNVEKVSLSSEVAYLRSYIDLQLQRFGTKVKVQVILEEEGLNAYEIEPMLLVPFVENAFKHGIGRIHNPEINIHLYKRDKVLFFAVANKYSDDETEQKDRSSGIGLSNVQRRLKLLYENDHVLTIEREQDVQGEHWFAVYLKINLH